MNNTKKLKAMQAERMQKFPPDRICFYHSDSSAAMDQTTFIAYAAGQLSMLEQVERGIDVENRKARTIFTERKLMREAVSTLRTYGEARLAAMIEREVNYLDKSRN